MESKYDIREFLAGVASGIMLLFMLLFVLACTGILILFFYQEIMPGLYWKGISEEKQI